MSFWHHHFPLGHRVPLLSQAASVCWRRVHGDDHTMAHPSSKRSHVSQIVRTAATSSGVRVVLMGVRD